MPADWPAWVAFNKVVAWSGDVGIWHETYLVSAGSYECVYNNVPPARPRRGDAQPSPPPVGRPPPPAEPGSARRRIPMAPTKGIEI